MCVCCGGESVRGREGPVKVGEICLPKSGRRERRPRGGLALLEWCSSGMYLQYHAVLYRVSARGERRTRTLAAWHGTSRRNCGIRRKLEVNESRDAMGMGGTDYARYFSALVRERGERVVCMVAATVSGLWVRGAITQVLCV